MDLMDNASHRLQAMDNAPLCSSLPTALDFAHNSTGLSHKPWTCAYSARLKIVEKTLSFPQSYAMSTACSQQHQFFYNFIFLLCYPYLRKRP